MTSTVHISTTQTVTETATITPAALLRRNANFAAQFAVANSIMDDVIANGDVATALALATPNKKQEEALSGFGNACSCETVAPLSTTTVTDPLNQVCLCSPLVNTGSCHSVQDCGQKRASHQISISD